MDLRSLQKPLKDQYRADPTASRITLRAKGSQTDAPVSCSVDIGRAIYQAEAHKGVGGAGAGACSGDLLARRSRRMRANHLSNGSRGHGHRNRTHRSHGRRRLGSSRHTRHFKGRPSRLRKHPPEFQYRSRKRNSRPAPRPTRKNRTILRRDANPPTSTQTPIHLAQSLLTRSPFSGTGTPACALYPHGTIENPPRPRPRSSHSFSTAETSLRKHHPMRRPNFPSTPAATPAPQN